MDKNETKYELKLDAGEFIKQLQQIRTALEGIGRIVKQQSGETYAIDVQIKNAKIERFFERLDKTMDRAEKAGEDFSAKLENEIGKAFEKAFGRAISAVQGYENVLKTSTKRITSAANKTAEGITDTYEKQDAQIVKLINRTERKTKESAQKIAGEINKTFRAMKRDLDAFGVDTSNMTIKDIEKFWKDANKRFDKRETVKTLTKGVTDVVEKASVAAFDKIGAVAEKNAEKQGKMLEDTSANEVKQAELAQAKIDKIREAAAEKERKRILRQRLYRQNVAEASRMLAAQVALEDSPDEQKLLSRYNRSVARIRGIYQSAVMHGRVENPETILAGLTELQQRSLALNNFRLSSQIGINDINEQLKTTVRRLEDMGTRWNKISSVIQNSVQAFATIQSYATRITSIFTSFSRNVLNQITSQVRSLVNESTTAFKSLEVSLIGFKNFFGEEGTDRLYQRIKSIAARAPGLATTDLAEYVRQIAPVSGHNADLALNASLGMLKTIQYGGASGSTEMEYVIKNIRDVITKGKATAIDVRQFNRAMPILEEVLESVGQSQLLKDGVLTINKDNVDTILSAFAALNTSNQSAVKDIFSQMNHTLSGQWEQFREQFTTNLMEALRGSQAYGGVQNLLSQVNEGEYVNSGLRKLQESLAQFINGINWFKVQRIAGEVWDGLKIIWEGFEDAIESIKTAVGTVQTKSVIQSFSEWVADIIRGMGDGIAQVVRFVKRLENSGIMNILSRAIGWFGSMGAGVTRLIATLASHITNISGNVVQLIARYKKLNLTRQLETRQAQLDAIPLEYRSQVASARDLLSGGKSPAVTQEAQAVNNLSATVTKHLTTIESNQVESQQIAKQSLQTSAATGYRIIGGRVYPDTRGQKTRWTPDYSAYPKATELFGGARQITSELAGGRVVATTRNVDEGGHAKLLIYNPKTGKYDEQTYDNTLQAYQAQRATAARLNGENVLQRSSNDLLRKIGNNKLVTSTIKTFEKAGKAVKNFATNITAGLMQGGATFAITETITTMVESLNIFGDATTYIAGVVKAAGLTIAGAMTGSALGIPGGGIIGALAGLGIGIAQLVDSVKKKTDEIKNTKFRNALDEEQMNIRNSVKDAMIGVGALTPKLNERTNEENYALQRLSDTIANSSMLELLALDAEGLENIYLDAKRYKTIQEDFTNKNEGEGFDWSLYSTGRVVTKNDKEYLAKIFDAVNKFDLLASHGYNQAIVDGQRVYVDDSGTPLSAETIWDEFFASQDLQEEVLSGQIDEMQKYLEDEEHKTDTENETFREKLKTQEQTIIDSLGTSNTWSDLIHAKLVEANEHLKDIANNTAGELSPENVQAIYGGKTGASVESWRNATGYPNAWDFINKSGRIGTGLQTTINSGLATKFGWDVSSTNMPAKEFLKGLGNQYNFPNLETDAVDTFTDDEAQRVLNYIKDNGLDGVRQDKILDKIRNFSPTNPEDRQKLAAAESYLRDFEILPDLTNILWWFRWLLNAEKDIESTGLKLFAHGGLLTTPAYRSVGVDTIPAMLSPGEFVMKSSAVKKAGLGMMYALNRGDLGAAAMSLAGNVNNNWYRNNNASINNSRSTRTNINNFKIINKNASARMNSYFSLANRLSF